MEKSVTAFAVRRQLGKILQAVAARGDRFLVERHGEPIAAVVPIEVYEQWKRTRAQFFVRLRASAERADLPEKEADKLANEAVRAVRAQPPR